MYKLLPEEAREKVRREYLLRRAAAMAAALIFIEVVALVGLFPSFILSSATKAEVAEKAAQAAAQAPEEESLREWLAGFNLKLKALNPALDKERPSADLAKIISKRGTGARFTDIAWARSEGSVNLTVSGVAADRQALLSLESRLNASSEFAEVSLPVSNLAKDKNIPFELRLTLRKAP